MASSNKPEWHWSETLRQYYYLDRLRNLLVLQDGSTRPGPNSPIPRTVATQSSVASDGNFQSLASGDYRLSVADPVQEATARVQRMQMSSSAGQSNNQASQLQSQYAVVQEKTDSSTRVTGKIAIEPNGHKVFLGTEGDVEVLNPEYRRRSEPQKFFRVGKVFYILWTEPSSSTDATVVTRVRFNEAVYTQIRRFVVIREGSNYCNAVQITTYGGRGLAKRDVTPAEHALIYTGRQPPLQNTDAGILPIAIQVDPSDKYDALDTMSRVNLGKIYTIEHNLKVKPFGMVRNISDLLRGVQQAREQPPRSQVKAPGIGRPPNTGTTGGTQQPGSSGSGSNRPRATSGASRQGTQTQATVGQRVQQIRAARSASRPEENDPDEDDDDDDDDDEDDEEESSSEESSDEGDPRDKRPVQRQSQRPSQEQRRYSATQRRQGQSGYSGNPRSYK